ncbi:hypothetical protein BH09PSE4_BH09PSE4_14630 [soil metagenome]
MPATPNTELQPIPTLRRLCGEDVALRFHDAFAGQDVFVGIHPAPDGPIARAIGIEAATALSSECGGCRYLIPSNRERRITTLFTSGKTANEIATELTLTARGVRNALKRLGLVRHQSRHRKSNIGEITS